MAGGDRACSSGSTIEPCAGVIMQIRLVQTGDRAEWLRLRCALWPDHPVVELEQEIALIGVDLARQPVFVAERPDGGLCGMIEVSIRTTAEGCTTDNVGYIEAWFVDAVWRGQGIGRRLVEAAESWARSQGCREMASDTTPAYPVSPVAHARLGYEVARPYHYRKDLGERR